MKLNRKHQFVLFALMQFLKKANKQFKNKPLEVSVSKISFIKLLKSSHIAEKSTRALYKNLETLEKKKLLTYKNKFLKLTKRGLTNAQKQEKDLDPYLRLTKKLQKVKSKGAQTYFKR